MKTSVLQTIVAALLVCLVAACDGEGYERTILVPPSAMHGVHGLAFDRQGRLYAASLVGQSIYRIDVETARVETLVGPPDGNADDVAVAPDGTVVWTAGLTQSVMALTPDGKLRTLARDLPGANSINFAPDGRLYLTTIFGGDALYEIDPKGVEPPRVVAEKLGGLNGFEVSADGFLYGPLFFRGKIVKVDLADGSITDVADGFAVPSAVNFASTGALFAVDNRTGEIAEIDVSTGAKRLVARLDPPIDNLAVGADDLLYVSNPAFNRVSTVDPRSGEVRHIVQGGLSSPGGIVVVEEDGRETLLVSDFWGHRSVDIQTGAVKRLETVEPVGGSVAIAATDELIILSSIWPFSAVQVVERGTGKLRGRISGLGAPYGVLPLADGRLLIADYGKGELVAIPLDDYAARSVVAGDLSGPVGLAAAGSGSVYVSEWDGGTVARVSLANGTRSVLADNLDRPEGLAVDASGRIILAESGSGRLLRIDPDSREIAVVAEGIAMGLEGWSAMPAPFIGTGIAVTADGTIYVAADVDNALYKFELR